MNKVVISPAPNRLFPISRRSDALAADRLYLAGVVISDAELARLDGLKPLPGMRKHLLLRASAPSRVTFSIRSQIIQRAARDVPFGHTQWLRAAESVLCWIHAPLRCMWQPDHYSCAERTAPAASQQGPIWAENIRENYIAPRHRLSISPTASTTARS